MPKQPWSQGHSAGRRCLSCGGLADTKPLAECQEERHRHRHETKTERNNEYRRGRRAAAREAGEVYVKGRGNAANKRAYATAKHEAWRADMFARLGGAICVQCGFSDVRALQFDHIDGGGRQHRLSLPSGTAYYRALKGMSDVDLRRMFQVLCANCNAIKREEREEARWRHAGEGSA